MKDMKGYIVPLLTSFNRDGSLDERAMRENISYLVSVGTHCITMSGSFGEFPLLSNEERIRTYELAVDEAAGRSVILAGTGAADTATTIMLNKAAESVGADGVQIISPYFLGPMERELREHFIQCSKSTSLPVMIYNNMRTGVNMSVSLIMELSHLENVVTVKQSSNNFFELLETIRLSQGRTDFHVTNGKEIWAFPGLVMGADAVYGISPLLLGRECVELYDCAKNGDIQRGTAIQYKINRVRAAMMRCDGTQAVTLRELLNLRGLAGGYSRMPYTELPEEDKQILRQVSEEVLEPVGQLN